MSMTPEEIEQVAYKLVDEALADLARDAYAITYDNPEIEDQEIEQIGDLIESIRADLAGESPDD